LTSATINSFPNTGITETWISHFSWRRMAP